MSNKPVILTGLRANNDLHIGNYFGALLPIVDMAKKHSDKYQINLFIPDLHSFTTPIEHYKLKAQIIQTIKMFVAAGLPLENESVNIYRQSYIPAHSELTWILACFTSVGEMNRMTQYKEKSTKFTVSYEEIINDVKKEGYSANLEKYLNQKEEERNTVGLFSYPILMAADILLYNATYIPVGDDQTQHLEFTRDIAERINKRFQRELFTVPLKVSEQHKFFKKDQGLRIKDLSDPSKKMSKSNVSNKGVIFLNDTPEVVAKKIKKATTDTHYDFSKSSINHHKHKLGVENLLQILALLKNKNLNEVKNEYAGLNQYGLLKEELTNLLTIFLIDFQNKYDSVNEDYIQNKLIKCEEKMKNQSEKVLEKVQKAVGLR